jgi:protocatechuate 3,4-dioxygenase beta subunit
MNEHDHLEGLAHDLPLILARQGRRTALRWLAGGAVASAVPAALMACGGGSDDTSTTDTASSTSSTSTSTTGSTTTTSGDTCSLIPSETSGPYPGDGTNSTSSGVVNVLTQTGIVRSDIRSSFNGLSGTAAGVPLTVTLQLVNANANASCASLAGYAVYLWHCDRDGNYSLYTVTNQNYLRGIQVSDSSGKVTFSTIFPACYSGRWPHIHFEIYRSLAVATGGNNSVKTSQLALPATACKQVYGVASGYDASLSNFAATALASDLVFSDDSGVTQIPTVTGDVNNGFAATLEVGLSV